MQFWKFMEEIIFLARPVSIVCVLSSNTCPLGSTNMLLCLWPWTYSQVAIAFYTTLLFILNSPLSQDIVYHYHYKEIGHSLSNRRARSKITHEVEISTYCMNFVWPKKWWAKSTACLSVFGGIRSWVGPSSRNCTEHVSSLYIILFLLTDGRGPWNVRRSLPETTRGRLNGNMWKYLKRRECDSWMATYKSSRVK